MHRGECVTTGGLYRPTHLCVAHFKLHIKVSYIFFLWCGKVGGCLEREGRGGGGVGEGGLHVSGGRGLHGGFRGGRGDLSSGLSQPGGKSC